MQRNDISNDATRRFRYASDIAKANSAPQEEDLPEVKVSVHKINVVLKPTKNSGETKKCRVDVYYRATETFADPDSGEVKFETSTMYPFAYFATRIPNKDDIKKLEESNITDVFLRQGRMTEDEEWGKWKVIGFVNDKGEEFELTGDEDEFVDTTGVSA